MSDVERYWEALSSQWGSPLPAFKDLQPQQQWQVMQSVNLLLMTLHEVSE